MFASDSHVFAEEGSDLGMNEFTNAQLNNSTPANVLSLYQSALGRLITLMGKIHFVQRKSWGC